MPPAWSGPPLSRLRALTTVISSLLVAATLSPSGVSAAGWGASQARSTGALQSASLTASATILSGPGTGGDTITISKLLTLSSSTIVEVTNTSQVPVMLSGMVRLSSVLLGTSVMIEACSAAWSGTTCAGTLSTIMPRTVMSSPRAIDWSIDALPSGQGLHVRVAIGGSVANDVTVTMVTGPGRPGQDRTSG